MNKACSLQISRNLHHQIGRPEQWAGPGSARPGKACWTRPAMLLVAGTTLALQEKLLFKCRDRGSSRKPSPSRGLRYRLQNSRVKKNTAVLNA